VQDAILQHPKPKTKIVWEFDLAGLTQETADAIALQCDASVVSELRKMVGAKPYQFIKALYEGLHTEKERLALVTHLREFRVEKRGGHPTAGRKGTGRIRKGVTLTLSPKARENMHKLPNASKLISDYLESDVVLNYLKNLKNSNKTK
jgi:hypothetical protein